jgi:hypothetical protein
MNSKDDIIKGYLLKRKSSSIARVLSKSNLRFFILNITKKTLGYKERNNSEKMKKIYDLNSVIELRDNLTKDEIGDSDWKFGFCIKLKKRNLILFASCKIQQEYWTKTLHRVFHLNGKEFSFDEKNKIQVLTEAAKGNNINQEKNTKRHTVKTFKIQENVFRENTVNDLNSSHLNLNKLSDMNKSIKQLLSNPVNNDNNILTLNHFSTKKDSNDNKSENKRFKLVDQCGRKAEILKQLELFKSNDSHIDNENIKDPVKETRNKILHISAKLIESTTQEKREENRKSLGELSNQTEVKDEEEKNSTIKIFKQNNLNSIDYFKRDMKAKLKVDNLEDTFSVNEEGINNAIIRINCTGEKNCLVIRRKNEFSSCKKVSQYSRNNQAKIDENEFRSIKNIFSHDKKNEENKANNNENQKKNILSFIVNKII